MLTITLFASLAVLTLPILRPDGGRSSPLQIVVAEPEVIGRPSGIDLRRQELLLEAVRDSLERQLNGRQGLIAIRFFVPADQALESARRLGADEVLQIRIKNAPFGGQVGLGRRRTIDGNLVWQREEAHLGTDDLRQVDRQLGDEIQLAYIRYTRPLEAAQLFAEAADYETYLRLRLEKQKGAARSNLLARLENLHQSSPRFFEVSLWMAGLLGEEPDRSPADAEKAITLLQQAARIAPADPRPREMAFQLLRQLGRLEEAAQKLDELANLYGGDPRLPSWRSLLNQDQEIKAGS